MQDSKEQFLGLTRGLSKSYSGMFGVLEYTVNSADTADRCRGIGSFGSFIAIEKGLANGC
jgi:hypothetical protein